MDYKSAYFMLFNKITDAVVELENAQIEAEESVVSEELPPIKLYKPENGANK